MHIDRENFSEKGVFLLEHWHSDMMATHPAPDALDLMQTVMWERSLHCHSRDFDRYCWRLRETGRKERKDE